MPTLGEPDSSVPAAVSVHVDQIVVVLHFKIICTDFLKRVGWALCWEERLFWMAGHVYLAELALLDEGLELAAHPRPVHVLLGPLLDPGEISPVVSVEDVLHSVYQTSGNHYSGPQVTVVVDQDLQLVLTGH